MKLQTSNLALGECRPAYAPINGMPIWPEVEDIIITRPGRPANDGSVPRSGRNACIYLSNVLKLHSPIQKAIHSNTSLPA